MFAVRGYVLHWNGARWSLARRLPGGGQLTGLTALSADDVWVFTASLWGVGPAATRTGGDAVIWAYKTV